MTTLRCLNPDCQAENPLGSKFCHQCGISLSRLHCLNPNCQAVNPLGSKFCHQCGTPFLLQNRYQCDRTLGQGGFGRTHLVRDTQRNNVKVVVKQFIPSEDLRSSASSLQKALSLFQEESKRLLQLDQHPQIPTLFEFFEANNSHYLVQQFIDGQTLTDELASQGQPFTETQIRGLLLDLLPVLQFIHSHNVIHRDIKPDNIIRRKSDHRLVLVDFGAAKMVTQTALQRTGTTIGSAGYAAPEQAYGKAAFASDLYSLGVTCLHLLTQVEPFDLYDPMDGFVWRQFLHGQTVSDNLATVLDRLTQSNARQRYQTPQEVQQSLQSSTQSQAIPTKASPTPTASPPVQPASPAIKPPQPSPKPSPQLFSPKPLGSVKLPDTVQVNDRGQVIKTIPVQVNIYDEDLGNGISLRMVEIPAGQFWMGQTDEETSYLLQSCGRESYDKYFARELPRHQVTVPRFFMGMFAVTQAQYQALMGNNPSKFTGGWFNKGENSPVEQVSWHDADDFCKKLSQRTGYTYRLPSEAEWEYACRAGTSTPFYFGETITPDLANFDGNYTYRNAAKGTYREKTTDVGSFPPNEFGLFDMHGNVLEWCADHWHDNYNGAPNDATIWPSSNETLRVLRGGSWFNIPGDCRSANRLRYNPGNRDGLFGFRVVFSLPVT